MSLYTILFVALVIPFTIIFVGFTWFFIRSRIAALSRYRRSRVRKHTQPETAYVHATTRRRGTNQVAASQTTVPVYDTPSDPPTYQPLAHFLTDSTPLGVLSQTQIQAPNFVQDLAHALPLIPGISRQIEEDLHELGYTCIEQIARWGRADVRAVSADLDVDQQRIEEEWVAHARLLMRLRYTDQHDRRPKA